MHFFYRNIMRKYCLVLFLSIFMVSCSSDNESKVEETFSWDDFQQEKSLKGRTLDLNDAIIMPFSIQVVDSVLISLESAGDMVCQLFNLDTGVKIGDRLSKGGGPNEMMMPMFVNNGQGVQFVDLGSFTVYKYDSNEFLQKSLPTPSSKIKLSEAVDSEMQVLGDKYIGYQYARDSLLYMFDESGQKLKAYAGYPIGSRSVSDEERSDIYQMGYISNGKDRIAVTYYMTDVIEIFDADGNLVKHLEGPEGFEYTNGGRDAFFSPRNAGESFFVLFNGRSWSEEGHNSSCNKLLSFSWDGKPECVYTLDDPIFTFSVDVKNRKVYGVSTTPEYHIVEYSLPE